MVLLFSDVTAVDWYVTVSGWFNANYLLICRFSAKDSKGGVAPTAVITVNLCNCSGNGECLFGELAEGQTAGSAFRIVACKCKIGYTGMAQMFGYWYYPLQTVFVHSILYYCTWMSTTKLVGTIEQLYTPSFHL